MVLSSEKKGTRLAGDGWHAALELGARGFRRLARGSGAGGVRLGGTRVWSWKSAEFEWVGRSFGRGPRNLDGWHAALEGPAEFGWVAQGPRFWMAGTQLWSWGLARMGGGPAGTRLRGWGPAEFGWVARGFGAGRPRF